MSGTEDFERLVDMPMTLPPAEKAALRDWATRYLAACRQPERLLATQVLALLDELEAQQQEVERLKVKNAELQRIADAYWTHSCQNKEPHAHD